MIKAKHQEQCNCSQYYLFTATTVFFPIYSATFRNVWSESKDLMKCSI